MSDEHASALEKLAEVRRAIGSDPPGRRERIRAAYEGLADLSSQLPPRDAGRLGARVRFHFGKVDSALRGYLFADLATPDDALAIAAESIDWLERILTGEAGP
jgi:hypothetical protein